MKTEKYEIFGSFVKEARLKTGISLRRFCEEYNYDPGNHSRLERGLLAPSDSEKKQRKLAKEIGLLKGSEEWNEFFDLAAVCRKKLPPSIISDDKKFMELMRIIKPK
ncbi:MAG: hypothetical protein LBI42_00795 [Chitinispirillales bacterium]|jgi:transcriptional regulator with XRE-family HTH domain|nr:hypothetical protein [Chitinispirillales bacterium]